MMAIVLDGLVTIVSVGIMLLHGWATRGHFVSRTLTPGSTTIAVAVVVTSLIDLMLVWAIDQPAWAQVAGLAIEAAGLWLFVAAIRASRAAGLRFAFDGTAPGGLLQEGPYARIRHPFYASYLAVWAGWALATWSPWAVIPLGVMAALYVIAARFEERLFASGALAGQYADYRRRAGLFWPKLG